MVEPAVMLPPLVVSETGSSCATSPIEVVGSVKAETGKVHDAGVTPEAVQDVAVAVPAPIGPTSLAVGP